MLVVGEPAPMSAAADEEALLPEGVELSPARRRLFEAALQMFGEYGYHAVSIRDLLSSMGLKVAALYAHVPSKQHLLFELVLLGHEEHRRLLREALLDAGNEPTEQVRALVRAHVLLHTRYRLLARICNRELGALDTEQQAQLEVIQGESQALLLDVIARGQRLGVFRDEDPMLAVLGIAAMGSRTAQWWHPDSPWPAHQVADAYADYALRLLT